MALLSVVAAVAITLDVHAHGPLTRLDHRVADRMFDWDLRHDGLARGGLTVLLYFGQRGAVLTLSVLFLGWLCWRNRTVQPLLRLIVALALIVAVIYAFKLGLGRDAPIQEARGEPPGHGASFPSGHVANAVVLWGLADWAAHRWPTPARLQVAIRAGRWIGPFAVTVGMTLLNYHWISDFLGGAAVGVPLLAAVMLPVWSDLARWLDSRCGLRSFAAP